MHRVAVLILLLVATQSACIDLTWLKERQKRQELSLPADSEVEEPSESLVLREEMAALVVEVMPTQVGGGPDDADWDAQVVVDEEIARTREHFPEFLMVSPDVEAKLAKGLGPADSRERTERFLAQLDGAPLPSAASALIKEYRGGALTPVQIELLAQTLEGIVRAQEAAPIAP